MLPTMRTAVAISVSPAKALRLKPGDGGAGIAGHPTGADRNPGRIGKTDP